MRYGAAVQRQAGVCSAASRACAVQTDEDVLNSQPVLGPAGCAPEPRISKRAGHVLLRFPECIVTAEDHAHPVVLN